jgi:hypothetical protein
MSDSKKTSASFIVFRVVLSAVFLLTALGASHRVRYVLLGILVIMILAERLYLRYLEWTRFEGHLIAFVVWMRKDGVYVGICASVSRGVQA